VPDQLRNLPQFVVHRCNRTGLLQGSAAAALMYMTRTPPRKEAVVNHHLREIADCLDEALRLQSRVMDLTEQVYEAAGMSPGDRTLRGKVTGLFFGLQAHLEELNRLAQDDA